MLEIHKDSSVVVWFDQENEKLYYFLLDTNKIVIIENVVSLRSLYREPPKFYGRDNVESFKYKGYVIGIKPKLDGLIAYYALDVVALKYFYKDSRIKDFLWNND